MVEAEVDVKPGTPGTSTQEFPSGASNASAASTASTDVASQQDDGKRELLHLNMGPQHPSTHGVLRLELVLDGEVVVHCQPVIGYLHTGIEKTFESKTYVQGVVLTDRMDYLNPLGNNLAYALAVEKLVACEIPERATVLRVLLAELTRLASHLMFIGSMALDLGASSPFLYCWREREKILDFFERISGARMMTSFIRPGGLARDVDATALAEISALMDAMPGFIDEYEELLTGNPIFRERAEGVGILSRQDAIDLAVSGPILRGSGMALDIRKTNPYCGYETYDFAVPTGTVGDCYDRYLVRVAEMRESVKICRQALDRMPAGDVRTSDRKVMPPPREELAKSMEAVIHHFKLWTEGIRPPAGEAYVATESPRGELGFYVVSDGSGRPIRVHERAPSFANLQALPTVIEGGAVADVVTCIASFDPIMGEVDR
ncbi:MAG: NADH-quinone oxidoreductase subunit D [Chloroflexi bacterium]|nr:NADH-quinone oxidoreductase subunit D [Chloroflexota bacterium]